MTLFTLLKIIHVFCAFSSIGGFALRGYWMMWNSPLRNRRWAKTLPHIIDTVLLGSAIGMLLIWQVSPFAMTWLTVKIIALMIYISLGMVALRFGKTRRVRIIAWFLAMIVALYILGVALSKSVFPILCQ